MSCKCNKCYECITGMKLELIDPALRRKSFYELIAESNLIAVNDSLRQLIHDQAKMISSMKESNEFLVKRAIVNNKHLGTIHKKEEEIAALERTVKAQEGIIELSLEALEELPLRYSEIKSINEKCIKFAESLQSDFCSLNK